MQKSYKNLIGELRDINPPKELETKIIRQIDATILKRNFYKKAFGITGLSISVLSFLPFLVYTINEFGQSDFYNYISLIFTDSKTISNNLNTFVLSLIDSTPFLAITCTIFFIFMSLVFAKYIVEKRSNLVLLKIN